ncbi:MAG: terpene cyclase/mutase family protein [Gemmataceae bacterium]|nr:terpene cyclase/mutase family protein [Gemmataceae bacterium]
MYRLMLVLMVGAIGLISVRAQTADEKKASVAYVQSLQAADGGFLATKPLPTSNVKPVGSLRATSSSLRALKYLGGEPRDAKTCAKFIQGCFDKASGGFTDSPGAGKPDVFVTSVGVMASAELKLPTLLYADAAAKFLEENAKTFEDIRIAAAAFETLGTRPKQADAWLEQIAKMRNADGTYGKGDGAARDTGGAVSAVLRLGGKIEQRDNVLKVLKDGQRSDGGFGKAEAKDSDLETSYRVLRSFMMLKEKPDAAKLRAFVGKCRNTDGGYGVSPGQPSNVGATYFASIILHWLDEK